MVHSMAIRCASRLRTQKQSAEAIVARNSVGHATAAALALALSACSFAPPLKIPEVPVADVYKERSPWTPAQPSDQMPRDTWWTLYGDGELNTLQLKLVQNSPDLAAALAHYQQA